MTETKKFRKSFKNYCYFEISFKKSGIWETKQLSTDVDSSTDTTVGWIKNTQKPNV